MTTSTMHDLLAQMAGDPDLVRRVQGWPATELAQRYGLSAEEAEMVVAIKIDGARPAPSRLEERLSRSGLVFGGELAVGDVHLSGHGSDDGAFASGDSGGSDSGGSHSGSSDSGAADSGGSHSGSSDTGGSHAGNDDTKMDRSGTDEQPAKVHLRPETLRQIVKHPVDSGHSVAEQVSHPESAAAELNPQRLAPHGLSHSGHGDGHLPPNLVRPERGVEVPPNPIIPPPDVPPNSIIPPPEVPPNPISPGVSPAPSPHVALSPDLKVSGAPRPDIGLHETGDSGSQPNPDAAALNPQPLPPKAAVPTHPDAAALNPRSPGGGELDSAAIQHTLSQRHEAHQLAKTVVHANEGAAADMASKLEATPHSSSNGSADGIILGGREAVPPNPVNPVELVSRGGLDPVALNPQPLPPRVDPAVAARASELDLRPLSPAGGPANPATYARADREVTDLPAALTASPPGVQLPDGTQPHISLEMLDRASSLSPQPAASDAFGSAIAGVDEYSGGGDIGAAVSGLAEAPGSVSAPADDIPNFGGYAGAPDAGVTNSQGWGGGYGVAPTDPNWGGYGGYGGGSAPDSVTHPSPQVPGVTPPHPHKHGGGGLFGAIGNAFVDAANAAVDVGTSVMHEAGTVVGFAEDQLATGVEHIAEPILGHETAHEFGQVIAKAGVIAATGGTGGLEAAAAAGGAAAAGHAAGQLASDLGFDPGTAHTIDDVTGIATGTGLGADPFSAATQMGIDPGARLADLTSSAVKPVLGTDAGNALGDFARVGLDTYGDDTSRSIHDGGMSAYDEAGFDPAHPGGQATQYDPGYTATPEQRAEFESTARNAASETTEAVWTPIIGHEAAEKLGEAGPDIAIGAVKAAAGGGGALQIGIDVGLSGYKAATGESLPDAFAGKAGDLVRPLLGNEGADAVAELTKAATNTGIEIVKSGGDINVTPEQVFDAVQPIATGAIAHATGIDQNEIDGFVNAVRNGDVAPEDLGPDVLAARAGDLLNQQAANVLDIWTASDIPIDGNDVEGRLADVLGDAARPWSVVPLHELPPNTGDASDDATDSGDSDPQHPDDD